MLGKFARTYVSHITVPIAKMLIKIGISANMMTIIGMLLSVGTALWFFPQGKLFIGTMLSWLFVMFDMLDGAIARVHGSGTKFGAILDSTCDRITDGAIFATLSWWAGYHYHQPLLVAILLTIGILSQVISYIKARAEASGLRADGGLIERTERLITILVGTGFEGLNVPYALYTASFVLLSGTVITVVQRLRTVWRSPLAKTPLVDRDNIADVSEPQAPKNSDHKLVQQ